MEEIYATRRARLRQVMDEQFEGKQAAIAATLGKQPDYISRIFGGRKQLGEDMAREFEEILKKPPYWFDGVGIEKWPFPTVSPDTIFALSSPQIRELEAAIRSELRHIAGDNVAVGVKSRTAA